MNKPVIAGVAIAALGIIVAVAIAAKYGVANMGNQPQYAQVVDVQPISKTTTSSHPHQVCRDETVTHQEPYKDQHQIGGAVVGGVVGGLLGNQIGGGKGNTLATLGGAAAGAFAGHEIQKKHQEDNATYTTVENRCHTVADKTSSTKTVGYDVTYTYNGVQQHVRMDHDPGVGTKLPVSQGVVVATGDNGTTSQQ